jgi:ankyrin repeat protein
MLSLLAGIFRRILRVMGFHPIHPVSPFRLRGFGPVMGIFVMFILSALPSRAMGRGADSISTDEIFQVIRTGNADGLRQLIDRGANVNAVKLDYSVLMAATLSGSVDQMKLLVGRGAAVNYQNSEGFTALWMAVPDYDKSVLLLESGADPQLKSKEGYTVLAKLAYFAGSAPLFQRMLEKGADLFQSGPGNILIYNASFTCDSALLGFLLRHGLNARDSANTGDFPIFGATYYRCFDCLRMLVENGADLNVAPMGFGLDLVKGMTPLMESALGHDSASFYYLLDHGANPNSRSKSGLTVMMFLEQCEVDDPGMTLALLQHGARPKDKAPDGTDALYYAKKKGNTKSVEILTEYLSK